ncbi:hypothetical protein BDZ94DRAFT_1229893, partial [Collybia nuda]
LTFTDSNIRCFAHIRLRYYSIHHCGTIWRSQDTVGHGSNTAKGIEHGKTLSLCQ